MGYRVELSETNRAGCQDSFCKKDAVKILKGELRLGTLVEIMGNSSLRFKHWGCVSGFQLQNLRESMQDSKDVPANGEYNWDFFDGLSDLPQNMQDKVKTAIREGKIADEDFKGDPEFNHLGAKGIRSRPKKEKSAKNETGENAESYTAPKTPAVKKRSHAKKEEQDGDADREDSKPIRKRHKKAQKEEDAEEDLQNDFKPANKRGRPSKKAENVKDETVDDKAVVLLTKNLKGTEKQVANKEESDVKKEEDAEDIADIKPARKSRTKKSVPKSESKDLFKQEGNSAEDIKPTRKVRDKRTIKNKEESQGGHVKMENIAETDMVAKNAAHNAIAKDAKSRNNSRSKKSAPLSTRSEDVKMENIPEFNWEVDIIGDDEIKPAVKLRGKPAKEIAKKEGDPEMRPQHDTAGREDQIEFNQVAKEEESADAAPSMNSTRKGKKAGPVMATAANSRSRRGKAA